MSEESKKSIIALDTTFRDGVQQIGVKVSVLNNALQAIRAIDEIGISYHELGFAVANIAAQQRIKAGLDLGLKGKVAAFGRTHPVDVEAIKNLNVPVGVLVGKTRLEDVNKVLCKTDKENLDLINVAVSQLVKAGIEVIFDAEHVFQALFEDNQKYALDALSTAEAAGATWIVLCDTNGKMTPAKITQAVKLVKEFIPIEKLGIHCHNDRDRAVVNSEAAWQQGVRHIQGTIGGFGERVGNADLLTLIPNLVFDHNAVGIFPAQLQKMPKVYLLVCNALGQPCDERHPWVGQNAFYTEAGMHADGEIKSPGSYFHVNPKIVGNRAKFGVTEQSGKANLLAKAKEFGIAVSSEQLEIIAQHYKELIDQGVDFGLTDAYLKLFLLRELEKYKKELS